MPIVPESNTNEYIDHSSPKECKTRRVNCRGEAKVRHKDRRKSISEARKEAKNQLETAIDNAKRDVHCPPDTCEKGKCVSVGKWYTGNSVGNSVDTKRVKLPDGTKLWEAYAKYHKEIRLKCKCR